MLVLMKDKNGGTKMLDSIQRDESLRYVNLHEIATEKVEEKFIRAVKERLTKNSDNAYIVSCDINNFGKYNWIYGYEAGNRALKDAYKVVNSILRDDEIYANIGAERTILFLRAKGPLELLARQDLFLKEFEKYDHNLFDEFEFQIKSGVYKVSNECLDVWKMINYASEARKSIKNNIKRTVSIFNDSMKKKLELNRVLITRAKEAIDKEEFVAYYQPIVRTEDNKIVAAEACARWRQADGEVWSPAKFIPFFEVTGFITKLDEYMYQSVVKKQVFWRDKGYEINPVTVNLSRIDFLNTNCVRNLKKFADTVNLSKEFIGIEITESAFVDNLKKVVHNMKYLKDFGHNILMDDFGSAYSTLAFLKKRHFDVIKLDKMFVDDIGLEKNDKIVKSIIDLVHSLDMKILAEGVETKKQYEFLKELKCDYIQGYYFHRPMTEDDYEKLLAKEVNSISNNIIN
jgi:EAL domain-containing protein (putative c-di-GMP-specific phosphodiesterase class I)/GGDEF domain-containing protein